MTALPLGPAHEDGAVAYLTAVSRLLDDVMHRNSESLRQAGEAIAGCLQRNGIVHAFGTGHSHMMAEELFYRAGGLVAVRPVLHDGLMLHVDATGSTELERDEELGRRLAREQQIADRDVVVVSSNSGGNGAVLGFTMEAKGWGATIIAITSLAHATSPEARAHTRKLHDLADIVLDNGGVIGDAAIHVDDRLPLVGPTSTVIGAALVNAVVVEAIARCVSAGVLPEVYRSANVAGGDEHNTQVGDRA